MAEAKEALKAWIIEYSKGKDALTKQITAIKEQEQNADVLIEGSVKNQYVIIQPQLAGLSKLDLLKDKHILLVTANTRENMDFLIKNWTSFIQYPHLCVYFVNPKSSTDKRWIIFPATHEKITERRALKKGIESLFTTVEPWKD